MEVLYADRARPDELYHHGILGMRWGQKNGPPYPLKPGDHSASEKKAGWRKSLDAVRNDESIRKSADEYRRNRFEARKKKQQYNRESKYGYSPNKKSAATYRELMEYKKKSRRSG